MTQDEMYTALLTADGWWSPAELAAVVGCSRKVAMVGLRRLYKKRVVTRARTLAAGWGYRLSEDSQ
jgi:predicted transcriptional regulator